MIDSVISWASRRGIPDMKLYEEQQFITSQLTILMAEDFAMDKGAIERRLSDAKEGRELMAFPTL